MEMSAMHRDLHKQSRSRDRRIVRSQNFAQTNKTSNPWPPQSGILPLAFVASEEICIFEPHSKSSVRQMVAVNHPATKLNFRGEMNLYHSTQWNLSLCDNADASDTYVFRDSAFRQA